MSNFDLTDRLEQQLEEFVHDPLLDTLARESGFVQRTPRKVHPGKFLFAFIKSIIDGTPSLGSIAQNLGAAIGTSITKQDLHKRMNQSLVRFLECVLSLLMTRTIKPPVTTGEETSSWFGRILIHDSTNIPLPPVLAPFYPSGRNQTGKAFATCKIQAVYDLLQEHFVRFFLSPYTENEQRLGQTLLAGLIQKGDLLIRDLGYFALAPFQYIQDQGAYFLSRINIHCVLFDPETGKRLPLPHVLRADTLVDRPVLLGNNEQLPVRLVAVPVPPAVARERRRKARTNRNRRYTPSKMYLHLLGWNIYVLNVPPALLSADEVDRLYGLRWRIETLFKIWKSEFHLQLPSYQGMSLYQAQAIILTTLIVVTFFHQVMIPVAASALAIPRHHDTGTTAGTSGGDGTSNTLAMNRFSIVKLSRLCRNIVGSIFACLTHAWITMQQLVPSCQYEKRKDRLNFGQQLSLAIS